MQGYRQAVFVDAPELLKQHFGLAARVDKKQRRLVVADRRVNIGNGVTRRMPGPRHALF